MVPKKYFILESESGAFQCYKDDEYGECLMAWESEERAKEFNEIMNINKQVKPITDNELLMLAMEHKINVIYDLVIGFGRYEIVKIKEWLLRYPQNINLVRYLVSKNL